MKTISLFNMAPELVDKDRIYALIISSPDYQTLTLKKASTIKDKYVIWFPARPWQAQTNIKIGIIDQVEHGGLR